MNDIVPILVSALTSSGMMSLVVCLVQRHDKLKEKEDSVNTVQSKMLLGLAHDRILQLTEQIIKRGAITSKEKTNLKYLYLPYSELGGNGDCETGYEACNELRVVSDQEARLLDERK